jgi:PAS domain S-box-containing protein
MKTYRKRKKRNLTTKNKKGTHQDPKTADQETKLTERLRFEEILTDLSAILVNATASQTKGAIKSVLDAILKFFRVDRCMVMTVSQDKTHVEFSYVVSKGKLKPLPKSIPIKDSFPWSFKRVIVRRREIFIDDVKRLPREAVTDRKNYLKWGSKAVILIPLVVEGNVEYIITISSHKNARTWPKAYAARLRLLGEIIANTLVRARVESALVGSEAKFRQFFEHIPEYAFIVTTDGRIIDANRAALTVLGYKRDEIIGCPLITIYAPEMHTKAKRLFTKWRKHGIIKDEEMVIVTKGGKRRTVLLNVGAVRDGTGKIIHSTSVQTDITDRKRTQVELQQKTSELETMYEELTKFSEQLHEVREQERTGIAQELHDELGQALTALRMDINWIKNHPETTTAEITTKTEKMTQLIDDTIKTIQRISSNLRPGILDDLGLVTAIEWQCSEFQRQYGIRCAFIHEGGDLTGEQCATVLFRVVQESLTNVARHARAKKVRVMLKVHKEKTFMTIHDNGKGIPRDRITAHDAFGINCMKQRVTSLGGSFEIEGDSRNGTTVSVAVPCGDRCND